MENSFGAKQGLKEKMLYWKDRDYQYEFGVTLGQAWNLAVELSAASEHPELPGRDRVLEIFKFLLRARLDEEFVDIFTEYYAKKVTAVPHSSIKTITLD